MLDGLDEAMDRWHGIEHVWNKGASRRRRTTSAGFETYENPIVFRLRGLVRLGGFPIISRFKVVMEIAPDLGMNELFIESESIEFPGLARDYRRSESGKCVMRPSGTASYLPGESASPAEWKAMVRRWQFLSLAPAITGEPSRQHRTGGPPMLNRDGSNLGQYLCSLREASVHAFNDFLDSIRFVLPFARDVQSTSRGRLSAWCSWR